MNACANTSKAKFLLILMSFCLLFPAFQAHAWWAGDSDWNDDWNDETVDLHFQSEAKKGNPVALTVLFFREKDKTRKKEWLQQALAAEEPGALQFVAESVEKGENGYPQDKNRALTLYRQALAATEAQEAKTRSGRAEDDDADETPRAFYRLGYLLARKAQLQATLGRLALDEGKNRNLPEALRLFVASGKHTQLVELVLAHPELEIPKEYLRYPLIPGLEQLAFDEKADIETRLQAIRLLGKLYEDEENAPYLSNPAFNSPRAQQKDRWKTALFYALYGEDKAAVATLAKKLKARETAAAATGATTKSGQYHRNNTSLALTDNGRFYYASAFGIAGRGFTFSWQGRWTENLQGQVCLTPDPPEIALFGRFNPEIALNGLMDPESISLERRVEYDFLKHIFIPQKPLADGQVPDDFVNLLEFHGERRIHSPMRDTSALLTAITEKTPQELRVQRHALNPEYNDYVLVLRNPLSLPFGEELADQFRGIFQKSSTVTPTFPVCGDIDTDHLERRAFSMEAQISLEKTLEKRANLTTIPPDDDDGPIYTRIPTEDLGAYTLTRLTRGIPENRD
ncbi:MAG: hypothetical protein LBQ81_06330 [Zoogloeaceae bacterium]|nr:hypothetical protein [Zoogloeaceae bacterium]